MSESSSNFIFFSPLTTPTVARRKLAEERKKEADFIYNFSSDSDTGSIFITQSKFKKSKVIKQPRRKVIESIIASLDSVDSDSGSEKQFATKHRKKKAKDINQTQDHINSDPSEVYSGCEKAICVDESAVFTDKINKCSVHGNSFQSDRGEHLSSKLPVSKILSSARASDLIPNESIDSVIGSEVGTDLTSSEWKISKLNEKSHVTSESEVGLEEQKGSKNLFENMQSKSSPKMKSPSQERQEHKRRSSSSSNLDSDFDFDLLDKKSKLATSKVKSPSAEETVASGNGSKESVLKGEPLMGSNSAEDAACIAELEKNLDSSLSPVIPKQDIGIHRAEAQVQSSMVAPANQSSETKVGRSKSTNHGRKVERFHCPEGFEEAGNIGETILPIKKSAKKEFWLIKTPFDFDISKLDKATIPLAGSIRLPGMEDAKCFEVMAIPKSKEVLKMGTLLVDKNLDSLVYGPPLAGQIHVIESTAPLPLVEIQPQPKSRHKIPEDLKQRHAPFGAEGPVWTVETKRMADEKKGHKRKHKEVEKRKKKKRKKEVEG